VEDWRQWQGSKHATGKTVFKIINSNNLAILFFTTDHQNSSPHGQRSIAPNHLHLFVKQIIVKMTVDAISGNIVPWNFLPIRYLYGFYQMNLHCSIWQSQRKWFSLGNWRGCLIPQGYAPHVGMSCFSVKEVTYRIITGNHIIIVQAYQRKQCKVS